MSEGAPKLLELFGGEGIRATYFATGESARRYPQAVKALIDAGHELGCHGMTHRPFHALSEADAHWEISEAGSLLRGFAGVTSFRAPYLRFPAAYLKLLEESGFRLDSSQAKYKRAHHAPSAPTGLARVPVSATSSVLRLPEKIRNPWLLSLASPVVLFVHPWEFVDLRRERLRLDCRFRTGEAALIALRSVIQLFKDCNARFYRMHELPFRAAPATS
jgi:peptidoglycan/xylan/chitin deacetylase (PgdA/CDA1 family)